MLKVYLASFLGAFCYVTASAGEALTLPASPQAKAHQRIVLEAATLDPQVNYAVAVTTEGGRVFEPVQWDAAKKTPYFILPWQASSQTVQAMLVSGHPAASSQLIAQKTKSGVELVADREGHRQAVFTYQAEEILPPEVKPVYLRGAFIHPIYTPGGTLISDSFAPDHLHHHGIWTAWSHTSFQNRKPDFWNVQQNEGRVASLGVTQTWSGLVEAGFEAKMRSYDTKTTPETAVLDETWVVRCYQTNTPTPAYVIDLETTQENISADPLELSKHIYGGLGFRGRRDWDAKTPLTFLTSEGDNDRKKGDGKRARWFYFGGPAEGKLAGVAILCHPDNLNAPQWTRFNPTMPFVAYTPMHDEPYVVKPKSAFTQKFRFVVFEGKPDPLVLEAYWQGFAQPSKVSSR